MTGRGVMWFRRDLRLDDNPAWAAATSSSEHVVALYVIDPVLMASAGPHRQTQLLAHLAALDAQLKRHGGRLHVRTGAPVPTVTKLVAEFDAHAVYANADVTPYSRRRDDDVRHRLDMPFRQFWGGLVHPPGSLRASTGRTSRVFSPFAKKWLQAEPTT